MALRCLHATRHLQAMHAPAKAVSVRSMATFDERERGEERVFFNKEEQRQLRELLNKAEKRASETGSIDPSKDSASDEAKLKAILGEGAKPGVVASLIAWKKGVADH